MQIYEFHFYLLKIKTLFLYIYLSMFFIQIFLNIISLFYIFVS